MNYIGSKKTLLPFIYNTILETYDEELSNSIFCDLFAGTGIVGRFFKDKTKKIISNDIEYYSYVLNKNYIENTGTYSIPFKYKKNDGFIYNNYCLGSGSGRSYFSDENGKIIDGIRLEINKYKDGEFYFLLSSLLESADKVANTASVYGAFLKSIKKTALAKLEYIPYQPNKGNSGDVYNQDSNSLIKDIKGDILYLDPPYNHRQYGSNYHILNTISKYEDFIPKGMTGLPNYYKSKYARVNDAKDEFDDLIKNANFNYIYVSYNNEGIINLKDFKNILKKYGEYKLFTFDGYKRFKADSKREHLASHTCEYLHFLKKV